VPRGSLSAELAELGIVFDDEHGIHRHQAATVPDDQTRPRVSS
jgi:hypothetical protein